MIRPRTFEPHPSPLVAILAGLVGTILATAIAFGAPVVGAPIIDVPLLIGGLLTRDAGAAFVVGAVIHFIGGTLVIPFVVARVWPRLPGGAHGLAAAAVKGVVAGLALFVVTGLLLPAVGALNSLVGDALPKPGFFALGHGVAGLFTLLVSQVAYGLALTVIIDTPRGIEPLGTLGWGGYSAAVTPEPEGKGL
jgi:hypothetical protein